MFIFRRMNQSEDILRAQHPIPTMVAEKTCQTYFWDVLHLHDDSVEKLGLAGGKIDGRHLEGSV